MARIRHMQAKAIEPLNGKASFTVEVNGEKVKIAHPIIFQSYESWCAVYDKDTSTVYLLPRWEYSPTTKRQLVAFIDDFTPLAHEHVPSIRAKANDHADNSFILCDGWVDAYGLTRKY